MSDTEELIRDNISISTSLSSDPQHLADYAHRNAQQDGDDEEEDEEMTRPQRLERLQSSVSELKCPMALNSKFQSLDFDVCENVLHRREQRHLTHNVSVIDTTYQYISVQLKLQECTRWFVMMLIGIFTALVAVTIDVSIEKLSNVKYHFDDNIQEGSLVIPLMLWMAWNASFVTLAAILVTYGEPVAGGSGIPQIKCFLNGVMIPHVVRLSTLCCKVAGVILSVVGGLSIGKEGPMIHSGAVIAAGISQGRSTTLRKDFKLFTYFRTDHEKRDFVSAGAAAGVSAAFGAPVGGVLFALEEAASFWNQSLTWRIFFASMISTFILNLVLSYVHGVTWQLSFPGLLNFGKFENITYYAAEIPIYIVMAVIGGLTGALFNHINMKLSIFRAHYIRHKLSRVFEVIIVSIITTLVAFLLIYTIEDCQALGKDPIKHPIQMYCNDGEYSSIATMFLQTPEHSVKSLFHDPPDTFRPLTVGVFALVYFLLAMWTYGLSIPSGLFIPCLLTGAAWGRFIGIGFRMLYPDSEWADPGKFAFIGAAAQLGGVVRMTISLTVILIEATGNTSFGFPIMIVLLVAKWVGDCFNEGIYDIHIKLSGVPMLGWEPPLLSSNIMASKVMSHPVTTFSLKDTVGNIIDKLKADPHEGFPVVEDITESSVNAYWTARTFGLLRGTITRSQLIVLLKNKAFIINGIAKRLTLEHFRTVYPRFPKIDKIEVTEEERSLSINLSHYMNPSPYIVYDNTSLPRVFRLFRGIGLRHLVVVNKKNMVIGIVTRKDLARYKSEDQGMEELLMSSS